MKGKCKFCRSTEHNILKCNDESIKNITDKIEKAIFNNTIYDFNITDDLFGYIFDGNTLEAIKIFIPVYRKIILDILQRLSNINLSLLARKNFIATSYPKSIHVHLLTNKYCEICEQKSYDSINHLLRMYDRTYNYDTSKKIYFLYDDIYEKHIFLQFLFFIKYINLDPEKMITIFYDDLPSDLINDINIPNGVNYIIDLLFNNGYKFKNEDKRHKKRWKIYSSLLCTEISNKNEFQCSICFEDFKEIDIITTKCNHTFCKECFEKTIEYIVPYKSLSCSMCRKSIENINVKSVEIYNDFNIKYK
jgi:hypothetical protein